MIVAVVRSGSHHLNRQKFFEHLFMLINGSCTLPVESSVVAWFRNKQNHRVKEHQRQCKCGAVYRRTEAMAPAREMSSFECTVCGHARNVEHGVAAQISIGRRIPNLSGRPSCHLDNLQDSRA
jgi:hypothetical protein